MQKHASFFFHGQPLFIPLLYKMLNVLVDEQSFVAGLKIALIYFPFPNQQKNRKNKWMGKKRRSSTLLTRNQFLL